MLTVIFKSSAFTVIQKKNFKKREKKKSDLHEHMFSCRYCMICLKFLPVFLDEVLIWALSFLQAQLSATERPETDGLLETHTALRLVRLRFPLTLKEP